MSRFDPDRKTASRDFRVNEAAALDAARESKPEMGTETATLVLEWLAARGGDREKTAYYMRDALRIGGLPKCRELIEAALVVAYGADYMRRANEVEP